MNIFRRCSAMEFYGAYVLTGDDMDISSSWAFEWHASASWDKEYFSSDWIAKSWSMEFNHSDPLSIVREQW